MVLIDVKWNIYDKELRRKLCKGDFFFEMEEVPHIRVWCGEDRLSKVHNSKRKLLTDFRLDK